MKSESIDEIVSKEAIQQVINLRKELQETDSVIRNFVKSFEDIGKSLQGAKSVTELTKAMQQQNQASDALNKARELSSATAQKFSDAQNRVTKSFKDNQALIDQAINTARQYAGGIKNLEMSMAGYSRMINEAKEQNKKLSETMRLMKKEGAEMSVAYSEQKKTFSENIALQLKYSEKLREAKKEMKEMQQLYGAEESSYRTRAAAMKQLIHEVKNLADSEIQSKKELSDMINALNQSLKENDAEMGIHQRNVGDYEGAMVRTRTVVTQLVNEMSILKMAGQDNTEEYRNLAKQATEYNRALRNVQRETRLLASNTAYVDMLRNSLTALNVAFLSLKDAGGFAEEGTRLYNIMTKLQKTIALLTAATQVYNLVGKESGIIQQIIAFQTGLRVKAETLQVAGTWKAVAAQKAFNFVASIHPYALIAMGIGAVIGAFALFSKSSSEVSDKQDKMNKLAEKSIDLYAKEVLSVELLHKKFQSLSGSIKEQESILKEYNETIGNTAGKLEDVKALEQWFIDKKDAYIQMLKEKSLAQAAMELSIEEYKNMIKDIPDADFKISFTDSKGNDLKDVPASMMEFYGDMEDVIKNIGDAITSAYESKIDKFLQISIDSSEKARKIAEENGFKIIEASKNTDNVLVELMKRRQAIELKAIEDRTKLEIALEQDKFNQQHLQLMHEYDKRKKEIERQLKEENTLTPKARQALNDQLLSLAKKYNIDIKKLQQEEADNWTKIQEDTFRKQLEQAQDYQAARIRLAEERTSGELVKLSEQFAAGEIKQEEYEKEKQRIIRESQAAILESEISHLQDLVDNTEMSEDEKLKIEKKIQELRLAALKQTNEQIISENEKRTKKEIELEKKKWEKIKELAKQTLDTIFEAINTSAQNNITVLDEQISNLDDLMQKNDERKEQELRALDEKAMSEERYAMEKEAIEQRAMEQEKKLQAEKDAIEAKKRQEQIKQAKWQKAQAIVETIINTARSIMSISIPYPAAIPFVAMVAALGAAQTAIIASQKIPSFSKGTDDHKGGYAIVGEGGQHEYIQTPTGHVFKTPNMPTLVDMPRHSIVYPDWNAMMAEHVKTATSGEYDDESVKNLQLNFDRMGNKMIRALKENKSVQSINLDRHGVWMVSQNGSKTYNLSCSMFRR